MKAKISTMKEVQVLPFYSQVQKCSCPGGWPSELLVLDSFLLAWFVQGRRQSLSMQKAQQATMAYREWMLLSMSSTWNFIQQRRDLGTSLLILNHKEQSGTCLHSIPPFQTCIVADTPLGCPMRADRWIFCHLYARHLLAPRLAAIPWLSRKFWANPYLVTGRNQRTENFFGNKRLIWSQFEVWAAKCDITCKVNMESQVVRAASQSCCGHRKGPFGSLHCWTHAGAKFPSKIDDEANGRAQLHEEYSAANDAGNDGCHCITLYCRIKGLTKCAYNSIFSFQGRLVAIIYSFRPLRYSADRPTKY